MEQDRYRDLFFMAKYYIKQYGLKRSGTCYTKAFIEANFEDVCVVSNVLGWKHGQYCIETNLNGSSWMGDHKRPNTDLILDNSLEVIEDVIKAYKEDRLKYVVTVRNPYLWIPAMISYDTKLRATSAVIYQLARQWNLLNTGWIHDIDFSKAILISYDELLDYPEKVKLRIASKFSLKPNERLIVPDKIVSPGAKHGVPFLRRKNAFRIYNQKILNKVNEILDSHLMSVFGYTFIRKATVKK